MNGIPWNQMVKDQFFSRAPKEVEREGVRILQLVWVGCGILAGIVAFLSPNLSGSAAFVLGANAVFALLSLTMAMLFWPQMINLKNDPKVFNSNQRWYLYKMATQMFWALSVSVLATALTFAALGFGDDPFLALLNSVLLSISVALTVYQALLLLQSVQHLYAATYWIDKV